MMSDATGRSIDELDHIRQSVRDILTTPLGARIMRRDYGSLVPELIDHPATAANRLRVLAASVGALARWEPRISIRAMNFNIDADGRATIDLDAVRVDGPRAGQAHTLSVLVQ